MQQVPVLVVSFFDMYIDTPFPLEKYADASYLANYHSLVTETSSLICGDPFQGRLGILEKGALQALRSMLGVLGTRPQAPKPSGHGPKGRVLLVLSPWVEGAQTPVYG